MRQEVMVLTPEKVAVSYRVARIGSRISAKLLDLFILFFFLWLTSTMLTTAGLLDPNRSGPLAVFAIIVFFFSPFLYFILWEALWGGLTPGKRAVGIRVRMADGTPLAGSAAIYRNMLLLADFLPSFFVAGLVTMFLNERSQRLGDLASGTMVVAEKMEVTRSEISPHTVGIHPYEEQVGPLRAMTADEYVAIKRLCDRFPMLPRDLQHRYMIEIWEPFAERHAIPRQADVPPILLMEAAVMKYGRQHGLL